MLKKNYNIDIAQLLLEYETDNKIDTFSQGHMEIAKLLIQYSNIYIYYGCNSSILYVYSFDNTGILQILLNISKIKNHHNEDSPILTAIHFNNNKRIKLFANYSEEFNIIEIIFFHLAKNIKNDKKKV
ncbi:hypothetical protein U3516DRAFT_752877 [Neocallimastix sp. 'constans']